MVAAKRRAEDGAGRRTAVLLVLALAVVVALLLRIRFFVGPSFNDDMDYIFKAKEVSEGRYYPLYDRDINSIRSMMTLPIAFLFRVLGPGEGSAIIYPLACSLVTVVVTFFLGRELFGETVGMMAAALQAFFPLDILFSTQLVPTIPLTLFSMASVLFFVRAEKSASRRLYFLSGTAMGLGYLANIMVAPVILALVISYLLCERRLKRAHLFALAGFLLVFSAEAAFMLAKTGDPLHRPRVIKLAEETVGTNTALDYYPRVMFKLTKIDFNLQEGNFGIYSYLFLAAALFALLWRERGAVLLTVVPPAGWGKIGAGETGRKKAAVFVAIFSVFLLLYLEFGVMTVGLRPIAKWVRYLVLLGPSFSLLIARMIDGLARKGVAKAALVGLVLLSTAPFVEGSWRGYRSWTEQFRSEHECLRTAGNTPIYADAGSRSFVLLYSRFTLDIRLLEGALDWQLPGSYVIVNGSDWAAHYEAMRSSFPSSAREVPEAWLPICMISANGFEPMVYKVPADWNASGENQLPVPPM